MTPYLPGEITDYIIGLVWPDKEALCSCSLVSSYDKLVEQINQSSSMRVCLPCVHTFTFQVPITALDSDSDEPPLARWIKGQRFILDFSGRLPNLRRAEFSLTFFSIKMHPRSHLALHNFQNLQELSLTNCHFDSFNGLRRMLVALPGLTSLTMRFLTWLSTSSPSIPIRPPDQARPALECLSLALVPYCAPDPDSLIDWLIGLPTPKRISLFMMGLQTKEGVDPIYLGPFRFMTCLSSPASVRDLLISPFEIEGNHVDLSVLVNLENLELCLTDAIYPLPVRWDVLCRMLQDVRSPLRQLRLTVDNVQIQSNTVRALDPAVLDGIETLDSVLESKAFRHLKAVAFVLISQCLSSPDHAPFDSQSMCSEEPFLEVVQVKLPKLYARGITTFAF